MKKILNSILFVSLVLTSNSSFSQENKKIKFGLKLGVNASKFSEEIGDYSTSNSYYTWKNIFRPAFVAGGIMNLKLTNMFSLQTEILYHSKGGSAKKESSTVDIQTTNNYGSTSTSSAYEYKNYRVNYVDVPLLCNFNLSKDGGFSIQAGLAPSIAISSSLRTNSFILGENVKEKWKVTDLPYANTFNTSLILGVAFGAESLYFDLRYEKTLRDTYSIEKLDNYWNMKGTMTTFSFSVGVFF